MLLIAGGLGSGKTTLLLRLLREAPGRMAVIVNEFGELGIDGEAIAGEHVDMMELTGGCVCCSLVGEFRAAVDEIIERFDPDCIAVEATGIAEADALVMDIEDELTSVRLDTVVVLVDADAAARFPRMGYAESVQIESADFVLLNKADLVTADTLASLRERVTAINGNARVMETRYAAIDTALLFGARPAIPRPRPAPGEQAEAGGHGLSSFSWQPPGAMSRECFERAVAQWPSAVYRAKGRVSLDGESYFLHWVAGRWELEPAAAGATGLVWIGPQVERWQDAIIAELEQCLV